MARWWLLFLVCGCNQRPLGSHVDSAESLCRFDSPADPARAVLATLLDRQLVVVRGDGSRMVPYLFSEGLDTVFNQALAERDGFVAAGVSWYTELDYHAELALLGPGGDVRWHGEVPTNGSLRLFLGAGGQLAAQLGSNGLAPDGRELTALVPVAEPLADGSLVVQAPGDGTPGNMGWLGHDGDTVSPLAYPLSDPWQAPLVLDGRFIYLGMDGSTPVVVSERPGDARTVPLPGLDPSGLAISDHDDAGWILVGDFRDPRYRVNVRTLESSPIGTPTPTGLRPFSGALQGPRLDADGALLFALRDDYAGALYRSTDGISLQRIGGTITNILDIDVLARGGTYLIDGTNGRYSVETWTPAPPDHGPDFDGDSLQLVRPQSAVAHPLTLFRQFIEVDSLQLSNDGRCLAYWDGSPTSTLTAWDVERARSFALVDGSEFGGPLQWIEPAQNQ